MEGGVTVIFDRRDYEILRLCGLCRYLPTGLDRKFAAPYLAAEAFASLREHGLIKQQSDGSSWKLTYDGRVILAEMGHTYAEDKRLDLKRPAYRRRLRNALWNVMLFLAGIDVFHESAKSLAGMDTGYLSSLMLRTDDNQRMLAGTRFLGVLRLHDTAYVPYFLESEADWIVPGYERETFSAEISGLREVRDTRLILAGNSLEELWRAIHPAHPSEPLPRGMRRFDRALEELGCDFSLVPIGRNGVVQLSVMKLCRYRERLAEALGCGLQIPRQLSECDGIADGVPHIIAIDFNVKRIVRALRQIQRFDSGIIPKICCLPFQRSTMFKLLRRYGAQKAVVMAVDLQSICDVFPEIEQEPPKQTPYMNKEGEYVSANTGKTAKMACEASAD